MAILEAARACVLREGFASLSTRSIADAAGVPLSQIHYHFGGKGNLVLALLDHENDRLLDRQTGMFAEDAPLWKRWEQACDYLDEDLASGYVRILQEMIAAGWSDAEVAARVQRDLRRWFDLLADVAGRAEARFGRLGPFTAEEVAALAGAAFLGAEALILLGVSETEIPSRAALRRVGEAIRELEERQEKGEG